KRLRFYRHVHLIRRLPGRSVLWSRCRRSWGERMLPALPVGTASSRSPVRSGKIKFLCDLHYACTSVALSVLQALGALASLISGLKNIFDDTHDRLDHKLDEILKNL